ncbi:MAG TPA: hypothetical protein IGS52_00570 [Oscillatoriaceae cyanobacterium M33_DOE_052]|uniref:Uncharacterized protein n=1 Tax=Planktothricoides sp. SpSt-374 TaxID=2282167 RepID=A0A7C3ZW65_9CYAN|nr:hypothetical protein [Oscillatoriaceae cyanobacterium M33_DOE_052]
MNTEAVKGIASEIQIFANREQKEMFLFVLGALVARVISLQKAAEVMEVEPDFLLKLLEIMGIEFSYLSELDVTIEKKWYI